MNSSRSIAPALLIAPWVVAPIEVLSVLGTSDAGLSSDFTWGLIFGIMAAVPVAYVGILCIGIPTYLVLRHFHFVRSWSLALVGFLVPFCALYSSSALRLSLLWGVCGAAVALVAWWLLPREASSSPTETPPHATPEP